MHINNAAETIMIKKREDRSFWSVIPSEITAIEIKRKKLFTAVIEFGIKEANPLV